MKIAHMMHRDPDKIQRGLELVREIYTYSSVGANLHVAVDDGNLDDHTLLWCIDYCLKLLDSNTPDSIRDTWDASYEIRVAAFLLTCTYAERLTIYERVGEASNAPTS